MKGTIEQLLERYAHQGVRKVNIEIHDHGYDREHGYEFTIHARRITPTDWRSWMSDRIDTGKRFIYGPDVVGYVRNVTDKISAAGMAYKINGVEAKNVTPEIVGRSACRFLARKSIVNA